MLRTSRVSIIFHSRGSGVLKITHTQPISTGPTAPRDPRVMVPEVKGWGFITPSKVGGISQSLVFSQNRIG